jgi:hypothetical protein
MKEKNKCFKFLLLKIYSSESNWSDQ